MDLLRSRGGFIKAFFNEVVLPGRFRRSKPVDFTKGEVIYRGTIQRCRPALFEEDQLERIKACAFSRTVGQEVSRMLQECFREDDILRTSLKDVWIGQGLISAGNTVARQKSPRRTRDLLDKVREEREVSIASSFLGSSFFGHWLRDDCATMEMLEPTPPRIVASDLNWPDMAVYAEAFQQNWSFSPLVVAQEAHIYHDIGFNSHKAERHKLLRSRLRSAQTTNHPAEVVYIRRGKSGARREIANEAELVDALQRNGVSILEPEKDTRGFIQQCLEASVFISIEGSQLAHALYTLKDEGSLLVIQPPQRFYNAHYEWARLMNMQYGIVVGEERRSGFHVYPDEVLRMINRLIDTKSDFT